MARIRSTSRASGLALDGGERCCHRPLIESLLLVAANPMGSAHTAIWTGDVAALDPRLSALTAAGVFAVMGLRSAATRC